MISVQMRVLLIVFSVITCYGILKKIKKSACKIQDAIFWIFMSVLLVILGIFPQIAISLAYALGIESPVNFVYLVFIFILMLKCFELTVKVSLLSFKIEKLTGAVAVNEKIAKEE